MIYSRANTETECVGLKKQNRRYERQGNGKPNQSKGARLKTKAAVTQAKCDTIRRKRWLLSSRSGLVRATVAVQDFRMPFFHKNIRLERHKYKGQHSYFITVCCERRRPVFANSQNAAWLVEKLREKSAAFRFAVRAYCVMPDHFHALVMGLEPTSDLLAFVKSLKLSTAREYGKRQKRPPENQGGRYETATANRQPAEKRGGRYEGTALWQKKFYDYILREGDSAAGVAAYIWANPVRKGLCVDPRDYPHSGSFVLDWTKFAGSVEPWEPEWKRGNSRE